MYADENKKWVVDMYILPFLQLYDLKRLRNIKAFQLYVTYSERAK